jgi:hypothetical protein
MLKKLVFELTDPLCGCIFEKAEDWTWWFRASIPGQEEEEGLTILCMKCRARVVIPLKHLKAKLDWPVAPNPLTWTNPFGSKIGGKN